jgi:hypothetical protein
MPQPIIGQAQITIIDTNDGVIVGPEPSNPSVGTLWIDGNVLKKWNGTAWEDQPLDLSKLDSSYTVLQGRIANAEIDIDELQGEIALKASQQSVDDLGTRLTNAEATLTVHGNQIAAKVDQTEFDSLDNRVTQAEASITANANAIQLKADQTVVDTMQGDLDDVVERVTTAEASITTIAGQISLKADQSEVDALAGTVSSHSASINVLSNSIESKVDATEVEDIARRVGNDLVKVRYIRYIGRGNTIDTTNDIVELMVMAGETNLAQGKTPTSDVTLTNPSYMTDGIFNDSNSYTRAGNVGNWIQIDLGSVREDVDYIKIFHPWSNPSKKYKYEIQVSEDAVNWTSLYDTDLNGTYTPTDVGFTILVNMQKTVQSMASKIKQNADSIALKVDATTYEADITDPNNGLLKRMADAETLITSDAIINTVTSSSTYLSDLASKANAEDLSNYATTGQLDEAVNNINNSVDERFNAIDLSAYATKSEVTQTSDALTATFSNSGGVNLLKNSVGFAGTDFWTVTGTVLTTQNDELDAYGSKSGFILNSGTISQTILVTPDRWYTISTIAKKGAPGTGYFRVSDGTTTQTVNLLDGTAYNYQKLEIKIKPVGNQITVELNGDAASGGVTFTSTMANIGEVALQWQHAAGEVYNSNIRMDLNGIRVSQVENGQTIGYTVMTPDKFAGYYDVDADGIINEAEGSADEVFRMDKDEFVMKKATVKQEITMGSIKIVKINSGDKNGWAFVGV